VKTRTLILIGAALPLLAASESSAASTYCTAGSLNACASVIVEKLGDQVMIRVRNLQGQVPGDNTWYSGLFGVDLYMPGVTGFSNFTMQTEGSVGTNGTPAPWQATYYKNQNMVRVWGSPLDAAGISGCNDGTGTPFQFTAYQTCAQDGWVVFSFTTHGTWDPANATVRWSGNAYTDPSGKKQAFFCGMSGADEDCGYVGDYVAPPPSNVTPEPVTLALLGTGLAGVGGAAARRRRKQQQAGDET